MSSENCIGNETLVAVSFMDSGRIINVGSVLASCKVLYGHAHYASSKVIIVCLTKTLTYSCTATPLGFTVNALAPSLI